MSGARLIVNARYFHIARPGETASKYALVPEAAAGLVDYIATRESVVLNFSWEYELKPATQKQKDTIEQFLKASPDIERSREYKAFSESKTAANASRLITKYMERSHRHGRIHCNYFCYKCRVIGPGGAPVCVHAGALRLHLSMLHLA